MNTIEVFSGYLGTKIKVVFCGELPDETEPSQPITAGGGKALVSTCLIHPEHCSEIHACINLDDPTVGGTFFTIPKVGPLKGTIVMVDKVNAGQNPAPDPSSLPKEECPLEIFAPVGGGDVEVTNESLLELLAGTPVPGTDDGTGNPIVFDPTNPDHYFHEYQWTLLNLRDEIQVGEETMVTSKCDATYKKGEKDAINEEPGGGTPDIGDAGTNVVPFVITIKEGSGIKIVPCISINASGKPL